MTIAADDRVRVEWLELRGRDGSTRRRVVVRHPGAVVIVPILDDGRWVLIRNHRASIGRALLELPAGTLEPGAPPIEQARRELEEETGYRCAAIEPFGSFYASPGICDELMRCFVATGLEAGRQRLDATEQIEVELMTLDELHEAVRRGELVDAKSLAALCQWQLSFAPGQVGSRRD